MARKRKNELEDFEFMDEPMSSAVVHCGVASISPVKRGKKSDFFDGVLSDGTSKIRFVGFSAHHKKKLEEFQKNKTAVELSNCEIKKARYDSTKMEVLLKSTTTITRSPKKIDIVDFAEETKITLEQLAIVPIYEKVTVDVKVIRKLDPVKISNEQTKQDVVVADETDTTKASLWGEEIEKGRLKEGECFCLKNFVVREWNSIRHLSMPRTGALITPIIDIGEVKTPSEIDCPPDEEITKVTVIGVPQLDSYKSCLMCRARVEPMTPPMGRRIKDDCAMIQRYDVCREHEYAKILLMSGSRMRTLKVFGKLLHELAGVPETVLVTAVDLLQLQPIPVIKFNGGVITEIRRNE